MLYEVITGRRHQRNKTQVLAHAGDLFEHLIELVGGALLSQLILHVGQHAARHLGYQDAGIDAPERTLELGVFLTDFAEIGGNLLQKQQIQSGIAIASYNFV